MTLHIARTHARTLIPLVLQLMAEGRLHPEAVTTTVASLEEAPGVLREHVIGDGTKTVLTDVHGPGRVGVSGHTVERSAGNGPRNPVGVTWMLSRTSPR